MNTGSHAHSSISRRQLSTLAQLLSHLLAWGTGGGGGRRCCRCGSWRRSFQPLFVSDRSLISSRLYSGSRRAGLLMNTLRRQAEVLQRLVPSSAADTRTEHRPAKATTRRHGGVGAASSVFAARLRVPWRARRVELLSVQDFRRKNRGLLAKLANGTPRSKELMAQPTWRPPASLARELARAGLPYHYFIQERPLCVSKRPSQATASYVPLLLLLSTLKATDVYI
eukprot:scaffold60580_cov66-Phaeocystis_antarctica.AAC.4